MGKGKNRRPKRFGQGFFPETRKAHRRQSMLGIIIYIYQKMGAPNKEKQIEKTVPIVTQKMVCVPSQCNFVPVRFNKQSLHVNVSS